MHFEYQTEKDINGWFYEKEGQFYNYLANLFVDKNIIEIGSYHGLSLSYIESTKNTIFAVEPSSHFKILQENISKFNNKKIKIFNEPSMDVCEKFPNEFFSMVFIG
jgi:predicted O-methyltransferase YrrM